MTALSQFRAQSAAKYPGTPIEFDDGTSVLLKSIMDLNDDELGQFNASQKRLAALDEDQDVVALKNEFVSTLSGLSTDKAKTATELEKEALGVLTSIFKEYSTAATDAAKSENDS